jgi:hypothetical protein
MSQKRIRGAAGSRLAKSTAEEPEPQDHGLILFHGSAVPEPIPRFRPRSQSVNSTTFGDVPTERTGIFLTDSESFAAHYGDHVHRYRVDAEDVADVDSLRAEFTESLSPFEERDLWLLARYGRHSWGLFEGELGQRFVAWLQEQGFQAATFEETIGEDDDEVTARTFVVFDPARVRPEVQAQPRRRP